MADTGTILDSILDGPDEALPLEAQDTSAILDSILDAPSSSPSHKEHPSVPVRAGNFPKVRLPRVPSSSTPTPGSPPTRVFGTLPTSFRPIRRNSYVDPASLRKNSPAARTSPRSSGSPTRSVMFHTAKPSSPLVSECLNSSVSSSTFSSRARSRSVGRVRVHTSRSTGIQGNAPPVGSTPIPAPATSVSVVDSLPASVLAVSPSSKRSKSVHSRSYHITIRPPPPPGADLTLNALPRVISTAPSTSACPSLSVASTSSSATTTTTSVLQTRSHSRSSTVSSQSSLIDAELIEQHIFSRVESPSKSHPTSPRIPQLAAGIASRPASPKVCSSARSSVPPSPTSSSKISPSSAALGALKSATSAKSVASMLETTTAVSYPMRHDADVSRSEPTKLTLRSTASGTRASTSTISPLDSYKSQTLSGPSRLLLRAGSLSAITVPSIVAPLTTNASLGAPDLPNQFVEPVTLTATPLSSAKLAVRSSLQPLNVAPEVSNSSSPATESPLINISPIKNARTASSPKGNNSTPRAEKTPSSVPLISQTPEQQWPKPSPRFEQPLESLPTIRRASISASRPLPSASSSDSFLSFPTEPSETLKQSSAPLLLMSPISHASDISPRPGDAPHLTFVPLSAETPSSKLPALSLLPKPTSPAAVVTPSAKSKLSAATRNAIHSAKSSSLHTAHPESESAPQKVSITTTAPTLSVNHVAPTLATSTFSPSDSDWNAVLIDMQALQAEVENMHQEQSRLCALVAALESRPHMENKLPHRSAAQSTLLTIATFLRFVDGIDLDTLQGMSNIQESSASSELWESRLDKLKVVTQWEAQSKELR